MVTLRLLGGTEVAGLGPEVNAYFASHPKSMAVLSYLALAGRDGYLRRDALAALFWEESDQDHARNALNQVLHALRRTLGKERILNRGRHEVGLAPPRFSCDVWKFLDALEKRDPEEALRIHRGDLLPGLHLTSSGGFERWLREERVRLRELASGAAWQTAFRRLERGHLTEAKRTARSIRR